MEIKPSQPNRPREPWYQSSRIVLERVEARLLRFCESRNVKKDGELMSFDILLVDGKVSLFDLIAYFHLIISYATIPS
ncbi:unnamed protein product [Brassica oleracea]|uniref:(rape) hypothetical protein n=1 Tax=Brassica napus TaxID=3708 RepID=A0A816U338_BRANA|nr:unnamed protein product [Brassica napus]